MLIKEVEQATGITKKNIRFYEEEGLLSPQRDSENKYRMYSDDDLRKLNEIKLLRKLGISIADIKKLQNENLSLPECMKKYTDIYTLQMKELEKVVELCAEIQESENNLTAMDVDRYIGKINEEERKGTRFRDIVKDYLMIMHAKLFFEPEEPIMDHLDFIKELELFADKKGMSISFLSVNGMEPGILLDGKRYICRLEPPRALNLPGPLGQLTTMIRFGFRWVYLYEDYTSVDEESQIVI